MQKTLRIATVIMTCLAVGYFSSLVTRENIDTWYVNIRKPFFTPPNWLFAPVWTILYFIMGYAAGRVWNKIDVDEANVKKAFLFFLVQLGLNALWSFLFFGLQNPLLAFLEILVLLLMINETHIQFRKVDKLSGQLLIPYMIWVVFATVLTASIWYLNK